MAAERIPVVVVRALRFRGEPIDPGARLDATPDEAVQLVDSGRARLHRPEDAAALQAARHDQVRQALRRSQMKPELPTFAADPRWQFRI